MIYDKLPVALLSSLAAEKISSTNSAIAEYILTHIEEIKNIGIKELSSNCHVGTGSISRFCKDIGLSDFSELKELIVDSDFSFQQIEETATSSARIKKWSSHVNHSINTVAKTIDIDKIHLLCDDILHYEKIYAFGMLKAEAAAINLQVDMLMQGKYIGTCVSYPEQIERIYDSEKDTLIIVFSYTGDYFNNPDIKLHSDLLKNPKIWMICSTNNPLPNFVDNNILFASKHDQLSHPYQLQAVSSIISQEYCALYGNTDM